MSQRETKPLDSIGVDWEDFYTRWSKARVSAIRKVIDSDLDMPLIVDTESKLLFTLAEIIKDCTSAQADNMKAMILKSVFDYSRILGMGLSKQYKILLELKDFRSVLTKSKIPCLGGDWESRETAEILRRSGCHFCEPLGSFVCDYWREGIDGLVMGLGETERYVRHASVRHGDDSCVDIFFIESNKRSVGSLAWGKIPEHMSSTISTLRAEFEVENNVAVDIKGMKEGQLYYMIKDPTDRQCTGNSNLIKKFQEKVRDFYPGLVLIDVTPRAVLGVEV